MNKPACTECGFKFSFWRSLTFLNPYVVTCPHCRTELHIKNANLILSLSLLLGLAIAGVAIACEETGRWKTADSYLFFASTLPAVLIPWTVLWWSRLQFLPINEVRKYTLTLGNRNCLLAINLSLCILAVLFSAAFSTVLMKIPLPENEIRVQRARTKIEKSHDIEELRKTALSADKYIVSMERLLCSTMKINVFIGVCAALSGAVNLWVVRRSK